MEVDEAPSQEFSLLTLSLPAMTCHLAANLCKHFGPDHDGQKVGPDLNPDCLTLIVFLKEFFEKVNFEKSWQRTTRSRKITQHAVLKKLCKHI